MTLLWGYLVFAEFSGSPGDAFNKAEKDRFKIDTKRSDETEHMKEENRRISTEESEWPSNFMKNIKHTFTPRLQLI